MPKLGLGIRSPGNFVSLNPLTFTSTVKFPTNGLLAFWNFDSEPYRNASYGFYTLQKNYPDEDYYYNSLNVLSEGKLGNTIPLRYYAVGQDPDTGLPISSTEPMRLRLGGNLWNVDTAPTSFTVAFWMQKNATTTTPQEGVYMGSVFGDMNFYFGEEDYSQDPLSLPEWALLNENVSIGIRDAGYIKRVTYQWTPPLDTWFHLAGTYDLSQQTLKLYVNGALIGTTVGVSAGPAYNAGWTGFALNGSTIETANTEYGNVNKFDLLGFWNRALSEQEVKALYNNGNGLGYYDQKPITYINAANNIFIGTAPANKINSTYYNVSMPYGESWSFTFVDNRWRFSDPGNTIHAVASVETTSSVIPTEGYVGWDDNLGQVTTNYVDGFVVSL